MPRSRQPFRGGFACDDIRDAAGVDPGWDVRFTVTRDGGKTWGPSARVSEKSSVLTEAMRTKFGRRIGPGGSAGVDGRFHVLWADHRTGTPLVWTAAVTVAGKP